MIPATMQGVVLTGHGGLDKLVFRDDLPVPQPGPDEVLLRVLASALNNTDINTRIGWYSKAVTTDTASAQGATINADDASWSGIPLSFPRIQGADCCGRVVAVGAGVNTARMGERVLVRAMQPTENQFETVTLGSEMEGAFAQYMIARADQALPVTSDWSDAELATIPCAFSTAEGMLDRANIGAERVLITGASGGVGSAAIQLAHRRGAHVTAMTSPEKAQHLGADDWVARDGPLPARSFDAVIDLVAGPRWIDLIDSLKNGGRYVTSGAIAGPLVELDIRTLYLRDLTLMGSTWQPPHILSDVIGYIEDGALKPTLAATFPLAQLAEAQTAFLAKTFTGKIGIRIP